MKVTTTLAMLIVASSALAEVRTASGLGSTADSALINAKHNALAEHGEVIVSEISAKNGKMSQSIASYTSGAARVLDQSVECTSSVCEATVTVDIDPRKLNAVIAGGEQEVADVAAEAEKYANIQQMGQYFDNVQSAFVVSGHTIKPSFVNGKVRLAVTVAVRLQPRWLNDVRLWSEQAGTAIDTSMPISDVLWIAGTLAAPVNLVGPSVIRTVANHAKPKARVYTNTNCFSLNRGVDVDQCYAVGHMMGNIVGKDRWNVNVRLLDASGNVIKDLPVAIQNRDRLFLVHDENLEVRFPTSGKQRKFASRGVVWFTDGLAVSDETMYDIPIDIWQRVHTSTTFFR